MSQLTVGTVLTGNASLTTQGLKLPSFTNSNRPASPNVGQLIFNTSEGKAQIWNGTDWDEVGGGIFEFVKDGSLRPCVVKLALPVKTVPTVN
jgi:hypothetical protein